MTEFLNMNGYGIFIWPCYLLTIALVVALYVHAHKQLKKHS